MCSGLMLCWINGWNLANAAAQKNEDGLRMVMKIRTLGGFGGICLMAGSLLPAQEVVRLGEVNKAPLAFLEQPSRPAGVSSQVMGRLGLQSNDPVQISSGSATLGTHIAEHGDGLNEIYLRQAHREILGVDAGPATIELRPVYWGEGPQVNTFILFNEVAMADKNNLDRGDTVGLTLTTLQKINGYDGMPGRITGPSGTAEVIIILDDRGGNTITMRQTLRDTIGVDLDMGSVQLMAYGKDTAPPLPPIRWQPDLKTAIHQARTEGKDLVIVVTDQGPASRRTEQVLSLHPCRDLLQKTINYQFAFGSEPQHQAYFGIDRAPMVLLYTGGGGRLGATAGLPNPERLRSLLAVPNSRTANGN